MQNPHMHEVKLKFKKENDSYIQLPIVEFLLGNNNGLLPNAWTHS